MEWSSGSKPDITGTNAAYHPINSSNLIPKKEGKQKIDMADSIPDTKVSGKT